MAFRIHEHVLRGEIDYRTKAQVGDVTASRKVKVLDCSMDEFVEQYKHRTPFPWHWGNSLYLEWYSEANGRVVIESSPESVRMWSLFSVKCCG